MEQEIQTYLDFVFGVAPPQREFIFHPTRKWRFDYAWPERMIAIEVEGGVFVGGRHSSGAGMTKDCEKYNYAALLGWKVLRFTSPMIRSKEKPPRLWLAEAFGLDKSHWENLLNK
jgi:hypothetical protein